MEVSWRWVFVMNIPVAIATARGLVLSAGATYVTGSLIGASI